MSKIIEFIKVDVNLSLFTFEDLDHPNLIKFYGYYWDITFGISTILFVLILYTVIKKSTKEMGGYKWYLCHQMFWSYIFELYVSFLKPITLWPFFLAYSGGFLFRDISGKFTLNILCAISVFTGFSIAISLVHRYVQASPFSTFYQYYDNLYYRFFIYILLISSLQGVFFYYIYYYAPDFETLKSSSETQNSIMKTFFAREPSIFGFDRANNKSFIVMFVVIAILLVFFIFLILLYFNFIRILFKNKMNMSSGTYELQKVLFKTLYIQICFISIILIAPLIISLMLASFGIRWVSTFALYAFMLISIHPFADFITMIYFIKPYRVFVIGLIKAILRKMGIKINTQIMPAAIVSTSMGNSASAIVNSNNGR